MMKQEENTEQKVIDKVFCLWYNYKEERPVRSKQIYFLGGFYETKDNLFVRARCERQEARHGSRVRPRTGWVLQGSSQREVRQEARHFGRRG